jgi:uncharacterized membrane protein YdfJ with MMPL/SSD domain
MTGRGLFRSPRPRYSRSVTEPARGHRSDSFARFGAFVYRRRRYVLAAWLVLLLAAAALAPKAGGVLKAGGIQATGSDSEVASRLLDSEFKASALNNIAIVFSSPTLRATDPQFKTQVADAAERVRHARGVTRVLTYYKTLVPTLLGKDRKETIVLVSLKGDEGETQTYVKGVRKALAAGNLSLQHYVTGWAAVNHDFSEQADKDLRRSEVFTFAIVLLLLLLTFRTVVSAALPLILGAAAVITATAIIYVIGRITDTSTFALNVASMIGLGLAIDFSLIVVSRFREELATRRDPEAATAVTMATAGRSIVYSGVTVMLGILTLLLLVDLKLVRSISIGVLVVAAMALLAGVTLLPAVLGLLTHRLERWRVVPKPKQRAETAGFWYRLSHAIMRRPGTWLLAALAVILVLAIPVGTLKLFGSEPNVLPSSSEAVQGSNIIDQQFVKNSLQPIQIVLKTPQKGGVFKGTFLADLDKLTNMLAADPRAAPNGVSSLATYMAVEPRDGRYQHLKPVHDFWPAPKFGNINGKHPLPGVTQRKVVSVWVDKIPWSPGYFGFGRVNFASGTDRRLAVAATLQAYRILKGRLTVDAGRATTYWSKANYGLRRFGQTIQPNTPITLAPGDQLVVPPFTRVRLTTSGAPVDMIAVVVFRIRPGPSAHESWVQGPTPNTDPFAGIYRQVVAGGVGATFPRGETHIVLETGLLQPGGRYPRHIHVGPELIYDASGTLTVFASPEMVITGADGQVKEGPYDTPTPVGPHGMAVVQGFGIHRAINEGTVPQMTWSLKILDASKPEYIFVALRDYAKAFVNLDRGNDTAVINVIPRFGPYDDRQEQFVSAIRKLIIPSIPGLHNDRAYVGGTTATFMDFRHELYGRFPYVVAVVLLISFVILMMFFQSVFLPLKAILMNVASLLATFGALVLIFQDGWGSGLLGFHSLGALSVITPAILFVILFSLSTDYEVFLLSRIKEYYARTGDNEESVARGLEHTGGVITAAGLILIGVFGSFATAGIISLKEIGLGLAIGVLIDTVLVRTIMVPATMRLAGSINWVMPAWLKRIVPELREGPVGDMGFAPTAEEPTAD